MQEEVTNRTVTLIIKATKLTGSVLLSAVRAYLRQEMQKESQKKNFRTQQKLQKKEAKKNLGKVKVKDLAAQNGVMTNIEITDRNIRCFERYARRYGINYAVKKDRSKDPPVYLVFFKGRDQDAIHAAFRDFSTAQIRKANKNTIRNRLQKYRAVVSQNKKRKIRQKVQDQSL